MTVRYQYCHAYGFDREKIKERLRLFQLTKSDLATSQKLQELVIQPNSKPIINKFYSYIGNHREYQLYLSNEKILESLKETQLAYLISLGHNFGSEDYFDMRLRVGVAHSRIGMPLSLYECAYQQLRSLILSYVPSEFEEETVEELRSFVLKIISLDMSLAIDSYMESNVHQLEDSIDKLVKKSKKLQYWSEMDPLTNILNRTTILKSVRNAMLETHKKNNLFSILMIDFDNLSLVNEKHGHMVGDLLLKSAIEVIKALLGEADKIGRYGGDEFIIMLPGKEDENATEFAKYLYLSISEKIFEIGKHKLEIHLSFGVSVYKEGESLPDLLNRADKSLLENRHQHV